VAGGEVRTSSVVRQDRRQRVTARSDIVSERRGVDATTLRGAAVNDRAFE
jgi:hypothetical protein